MQDTSPLARKDEVRMHVSSRMEEIPAGRPRTVTLTGALLLMEWLVFLGLGILHLVVILDAYQASDEVIWLLDSLEVHGDHARLMSVLLSLLAFTTLLAALGFFRVWYLAWLMATAAQGVALLISIVLYFTGKPVFIFPVMVLSIIIVSYLNYPEVQETFRSRETVFCRKVMQ